MPRLFIALPLPDETLAAVAACQQHCRERLPKLRWSRPQQLHLTLRFLGDQPEDSLEKLADIVLSVGRSHPPLDLLLDRLGAFPAPDRARVVWLGVAASDPLQALYAALSRELQQHAGIPREGRRFHPHLTLGRCRGGIDLGNRLSSGGLPLAFRATQLVLFRSELQPGGAIHQPLTCAPLTGRDIFRHDSRISDEIQ